MASETSRLVVAGIVDDICDSVVSCLEERQGRDESALVVDDLLRSLLDKCLNLVDKGLQELKPINQSVVQPALSPRDSGTNVESEEKVQRPNLPLLPESSGALIASPTHSLNEFFDEAVCIHINHEEPINPDEPNQSHEGNDSDDDGRESRCSAESKEADECIEVDIEQDESSIQIIEVEDNGGKSSDKKDGGEVSITETEDIEVDVHDKNDVEDENENGAFRGDVGGKNDVEDKNEEVEMNEGEANVKVRKQVGVEEIEEDEEIREVVEENKEEYGGQGDVGDNGREVAVNEDVAHNGDDRVANPTEITANEEESCGSESSSDDDPAADQLAPDDETTGSSVVSHSKERRGGSAVSVLEEETDRVSKGEKSKDDGSKMDVKNFSNSKQRILQESNVKGKSILRSSLLNSELNTKRIDRLNNNDEKLSDSRKGENNSFRCFACSQYALVIFQSSANFYRHVRRMHKIDLLEYVEKYSSSEHFLECRLCGADDVQQSVKSIETHLKQSHPKSSFEDFFGIKKVDKTKDVGNELVTPESRRRQIDDFRSTEELSNRQNPVVISPISKSAEFNFEEEYSKSSLQTESRHHFRCQICKAFKSFVLKDARTHMDRVHGRGQWSKIAFSVQRLHKCLVCDQFVQVEEAEFTNHLKGHVCSWQDYLQLNSAQTQLFQKIAAKPSQHDNINVNWNSVDPNGGIPHLSIKSNRPPPAVLELISPKVNGSVVVSKEGALSTSFNTTRTQTPNKPLLPKTQTASISTPNNVPTTATALITSTHPSVETTSSISLPTSVVNRLSTLRSASATKTKPDLQTLTCVDPPVKIHSSLLKGVVQRSSTIGNHCTFACLVPGCRAQSASFSAICQHSQVAHNSPRLVPQVTQLTLHKCILCQQDVMCDTAIIVKHVLRHEVSVVSYKAQLDEMNKKQEMPKEQEDGNQQQDVQDREQGISKEQPKNNRQPNIQRDRVHGVSKEEAINKRQQNIQEEQGKRHTPRATHITTLEEGKSPENNVKSSHEIKATKRKDEEKSQFSSNDRERKVARKLPQNLPIQKRCEIKPKQEMAVGEKMKTLAEKNVPSSKSSKSYRSIISSIHNDKEVAQQKATKKTGDSMTSAPSTSSPSEEPRLPSKVAKFDASEVAQTGNCNAYHCVFCNKVELNVNIMKRHLIKAHHVPSTMGLLDNVLEKCKPKSRSETNNSIASQSATTNEQQSSSVGKSSENGCKSGSKSSENGGKSYHKDIPKGDKGGHKDMSKKVATKSEVNASKRVVNPNEVNTSEEKRDDITWHECAVCGKRVRNSVAYIKRHLLELHDLPLSTYLRRMALKRRASNESEESMETTSKETKTRRKQSLAEVKKEMEESDDIVFMYESNPVSDKRT